MNYVTLKSAKRYMGLDLSETLDDDRITDFIEWSTTFIENYKNRHYDPRIETHVFDKPSAGGSSFGMFEQRLQPIAPQPPLRFDEDLLELDTLTNGDGEEITGYVLEPANVYPKMRIRLKSGDSWKSDGDGESKQVISVLGWWGSHDKYTQAWRDSGQAVVDNPLDSSSTAVKVADIAAFQIGQLLRIDAELMLISDAEIISTVPTLTVERAYNGSTAASHAAGAKIKIWKLQGTIEQACLRMVKWRYNQKDVDAFDKTYIAEGTALLTPSAIPTDILAVLGAPKATL